MATTNKLNFFRFFFISILGVLLHFTYEWSNDNPAVGLFSAVNESTWEHIKDKPLPEHYLPARTVGILSGMAFIVVGFYTLNGVLGRNYEFLNIALYFAGVVYALRTENRLESRQMCINDYVSMTILAILAVAFFAFTNYPPELGIFADPTAD